MTIKFDASLNGPEKKHRPEFWQVLMRVTQIGAIVDVAFFFLFYALGSPILAWVNIFSVAMYTCAYYAIKHRENKLAGTLIWTEVMLHAALGIILIGWESGFHYYLLIFIPGICLSASRQTAIKALMLLFVFYIGLDVLTWFVEPVQPINEVALQIVHLFNLGVVFLMFSYLSLFYIKTVRRAQKKLHIMATTDPLTELFNRRYMTHLADAEVTRFNRAQNSLGILLIDIDHFKSINDTFGHEIGDTVLVKVAEILRGQLRKQDLISRWGGEEFLVILPELEINEAQLSAERVRQSFIAYDWVAATEQHINPTISVGVTQLKPNESLSNAIAQADKALYRSKENGRNRVESD